MQYIEPITAIALAISTGIAWLIYNSIRQSRAHVKWQSTTDSRVKRLEEWRQSHSEETKQFTKVLHDVEKELAYWRGRRDAPAAGD